MPHGLAVMYWTMRYSVPLLDLTGIDMEVVLLCTFMTVLITKLLYGAADLELIVVSLSKNNNYFQLCLSVFIDHHHPPLLFLMLCVKLYFLYLILIFLILSFLFTPL